MPILGTKRRCGLEENASDRSIMLSLAGIATLEGTYPVGGAAGDDRFAREVG